MITFASGIILYRLGAAEGASGADAPGPRLLLLRNRETGQWGFAKGRRDGADAHEVETALREVEEETGYRGLRLHAGYRQVLDYTVREPDRPPYCKSVVYFLAEAPPSEPVLSREHDALLWADAATVQARLAYGQLRDLARGVFAVLARA